MKLRIPLSDGESRLSFRLVAPLLDATGPLEHLTLHPGCRIERWKARQLEQFLHSHDMDDDQYTSACYRCIDADSETGLIITAEPEFPEPPASHTSHYLNHYTRHMELFNDKVSNALALMRLFHDGNIRQHSWWWFGTDGSQYSQTHYSHATYVASLFSLHEEQVDALNSYLRETPFPLKRDYLNLAFDNYEEAYQTTKLHLQHLSLTIALEALFTPATKEMEMRYRVSRSAAAILGTSRKHSEELLKFVRGAYDRRSDIVHKADISSAKQSEVAKLRKLVRQLIFRLQKADLTKNELLSELTAASLNGDFSLPT